MNMEISLKSTNVCQQCASANSRFSVQHVQLLRWVIIFDVWANHSTLKHCPACNSFWHLWEFATKAQMVDSLKNQQNIFKQWWSFLPSDNSKNSNSQKKQKMAKWLLKSLLYFQKPIFSFYHSVNCMLLSDIFVSSELSRGSLCELQFFMCWSNAFLASLLLTMAHRTFWCVFFFLEISWSWMPRTWKLQFSNHHRMKLCCKHANVL